MSPDNHARTPLAGPTYMGLARSQHVSMQAENDRLRQQLCAHAAERRRHGQALAAAREAGHADGMRAGFSESWWWHGTFGFIAGAMVTAAALWMAQSWLA